jgi:hypothetical protein
LRSGACCPTARPSWCAGAPRRYPIKARGPDDELSFRSHSAEGFAEELQAALATDELFHRWRRQQEEPDEADGSLGAINPAARVCGEQNGLAIMLKVQTWLSSELLRQRQRLRWLAGPHWKLRKVTS